VRLLTTIVLIVVMSNYVALNAVNAAPISDLFLWRQAVNKSQLPIANKVQKVFPFRVKAVKVKE